MAGRLAVLEPIEMFANFLNEFSAGGNKVYREAIKTLSLLIGDDKRRLFVNYDHLYSYNPDLARKLLSEPMTMLEEFNEAALRVLKSVDEDFFNTEPRIKIRLHNLPNENVVGVRGIRAEHLSKYITVKGMIGGMTKAEPRVVDAAWECNFCQDLEYQPQPQYQAKLIKPSNCKLSNEHAGSGRYAPTFHPELSVMIDCQKAYLIEPAEEVHSPNEPQKLMILITEDLVDRKDVLTGVGEYVYVCGILKSYIKTRQNTLTQDLGFYVEVNNIIMRDKNLENVELTQKDLEEIEKIKSDPLLLEKLKRSLVYHLKMPDEILESLIYFCAASQPPDEMQQRYIIHLLIVGDAGKGKSQLIKRIASVIPRSHYLDAYHVTKGGLTAGAEKDELIGSYSIKAGWTVICDGAILGLDEIDKANKEDIKGLTSQMESLEVTHAVTGASATMKARTSILGAANPSKYGKYDANKSLWDNININAFLADRFDLMWLLEDNPERQEDMELADFIEDVESGKIKPPLPTEFLTKYFIKIRSDKIPPITQEANKRFKDFWVEVRDKHKTADNQSIPLSTRHLKALKRLGIARAKALQKSEVDLEDAQAIERLFLKYLNTFFVNEITGKFDILPAITGKSQAYLKTHDCILKFMNEHPTYTYTIDEIIEIATKEKNSEEHARKVFKELIADGKIYERDPNRYTGHQKEITRTLMMNNNKKISTLYNSIKKFIVDNPQMTSKATVLKTFGEQGYSQTDVEKVLKRLFGDGVIYEPQDSQYKAP